MHDPLKNLRRNRRGHEAIEPAVAAQMKGVGNAIGEALEGTGYGFALLVFPFGDSDGRMNYISNSNREDMLVAMKEFIASHEGRFADTPDTVQ